MECDRCRGLLGHFFDRLGSTLFLDDDPDVLAQAFDPRECDRDGPRVIAARIVLTGRERIFPSDLPNQDQPGTAAAH
jgi:hypothetical protein